MTYTPPTQQVPGQLELPLEIKSESTHKITYTKTVTTEYAVTETITAAHSYGALIDQAHARPIDYQRTLKSFVLSPERYEGIVFEEYEIDKVSEQDHHHNFRIS